MKKLITLFSICFAITGAQASEILNLQAVFNLPVISRQAINWKVGDEMRYDMTIEGFPIPLPMTSVKTVTGEEGNGVWVTQLVDMVIQKQKSEVLYDRATAKVLKYKENGQEKPLPESGDVEIVSQDTQEIDVKAGHFDSLHVILNTSQAKGIEVWINPLETAIDGTLKMIIPTEQQGKKSTITMELKSFKKN
jgi:hypothetical protein